MAYRRLCAGSPVPAADKPQPKEDIFLKKDVLFGLYQALMPGFPFRLLDKTELIAGKSADSALDIRLGFRHGYWLVLNGNVTVKRILHEALTVGGHYTELDPVGTAIGAKIRFILHLAICH